MSSITSSQHNAKTPEKYVMQRPDRTSKTINEIEQQKAETVDPYIQGDYCIITRFQVTQQRWTGEL